MDNYKCFECNKVYSASEVGAEPFCSSCGGGLEMGFFKEESPQDRIKTGSSHKHADDLIIFGCLSCVKSIALKYPFKFFSFRCPNCLSRYEIKYSSSFPEMYIFVPTDFISQYDKTNGRPDIPIEVKNAFELFELNDDVSFDDVKTKYRKAMTQYHPDKAAHLGHESRILAEEKTKAYNAAFSIIQCYFNR